MSECSLGSIWTVAGLDKAMAVVLAGPFAAARGVPEYLVAPLYLGTEAGFAWTDEDVRLEAGETGLGEVRFAAIWNARPLLQEDLCLEVGLLPDAATTDLRDVYWASINEERVSGPRLGKPIRSRRSLVAAFQESELSRWASVSGRVLAKALESEAIAESVLAEIQFTAPDADSPLFVSSDSLRQVLFADPFSISDDTLLRGSWPVEWYGASMGGTMVTTHAMGFAANISTEFEGRLTVGMESQLTAIESRGQRDAA